MLEERPSQESGPSQSFIVASIDMALLLWTLSAVLRRKQLPAFCHRTFLSLSDSSNQIGREGATTSRRRKGGNDLLLTAPRASYFSHFNAIHMFARSEFIPIRFVLNIHHYPNSFNGK